MLFSHKTSTEEVTATCNLVTFTLLECKAVVFNINKFVHSLALLLSLV